MKQGLVEQGMYKEQEKNQLPCPDHTEGNMFNCDLIELTFVKQLPGMSDCEIRFNSRLQGT